MFENSLAFLTKSVPLISVSLSGEGAKMVEATDAFTVLQES